MQEPPRKFNDGQWLADLIAKKRWSQRGLVESQAKKQKKDRFSLSTLQRIVKMKDFTSHAHTLDKIAEALGMSIDEFKRARDDAELEQMRRDPAWQAYWKWQRDQAAGWDGSVADAVARGMPLDDRPLRTYPPRDKRRKDRRENTNDGVTVIDRDFNNIQMGSFKSLHEIPTWDLNIAAGGWVTVPIGGELDYEDPRQRAVIEQGLFRVCIDGDSMIKDWMPGDCVEFEIFRPDRDGLRIGEDYLIVRAGGDGTFKRLKSFDDDQLLFEATNRRKYPKPIPVFRQDITRMARALHVIVDRRKGR